jgi:hypothetical protein
MDLQARKITFVQEFPRLENEEIVNGLEDLLRKKKAEHYKQELKPMSAAQFNDEIDPISARQQNSGLDYRLIMILKKRGETSWKS